MTTNNKQETKNNKLRSFVICRMYAGAYISNKMGGEVINLLHDDHDNNYIYVNPYGYIAKEYDDTVEAVLLVRLLQKGCFEIVGIAKIGPNGQIVYPVGNTTKEKHVSSGKQLMAYEKKHDIRYGGIKLSDIFYGQLDGAITFKSDALLEPIKPIYITDCDHKDMKLDDKTNNLDDKRFPTQSLIAYIDNIRNPHSFEEIDALIKDNSLWDRRRNKVSNNKIIDRNFNFLNVIKKEDDELVYSNLFYYFFSKYPDLLVRFASDVLKLELSLPITIEREKDNIDIWIEDKNNIIVIENKIKSGINGVSPRHNFSEEGLVQSQLSRYYHHAEKHKGNKKTSYFIFLPVYSRIDISIYSSSKYYLKISYKELYDFFLKVEFSKEKIDEFYYKEFVKSLYKHTKDRQIDYYEDMAYRFIQRIKTIKSNMAK